MFLKHSKISHGCVFFSSSDYQFLLLLLLLPKSTTSATTTDTTTTTTKVGWSSKGEANEEREGEKGKDLIKFFMFHLSSFTSHHSLSTLESFQNEVERGRLWEMQKTLTFLRSPMIFFVMSLVGLNLNVTLLFYLPPLWKKTVIA